MPPKIKTPSKASIPKSDPTVHLAVDDAIKAVDIDAITTSEPVKASTGTNSGPAVTAPSTKRKLAYPVPSGISPSAINNTESLLRFVILALISAAAIGSRLFAVIRFESVIHEL